MIVVEETEPTTPLPVLGLLVEAWPYWRAAKDNDDTASWMKWGEAIDALLDRYPRG